MKMPIVVMAGLLAAIALPAQAEELSPWFGGEATDSFQIVIEEPPALLKSDTQLVTADISCELPDCPQEAKLAKGAPDAEAP